MAQPAQASPMPAIINISFDAKDTKFVSLTFKNGKVTVVNTVLAKAIGWNVTDAAPYMNFSYFINNTTVYLGVTSITDANGNPKNQLTVATTPQNLEVSVLPKDKIFTINYNFVPAFSFYYVEAPKVTTLNSHKGWVQQLLSLLQEAALPLGITFLVYKLMKFIINKYVMSLVDLGAQDATLIGAAMESSLPASVEEAGEAGEDLAADAATSAEDIGLDVLEDAGEVLI